MESRALRPIGYSLSLDSSRKATVEKSVVSKDVQVLSDDEGLVFETPFLPNKSITLQRRPPRFVSTGNTDYLGQKPLPHISTMKQQRVGKLLPELKKRKADLATKRLSQHRPKAYVAQPAPITQSRIPAKKTFLNHCSPVARLQVIKRSVLS